MPLADPLELDLPDSPGRCSSRKRLERLAHDQRRAAPSAAPPRGVADDVAGSYGHVRRAPRSPRVVDVRAVPGVIARLALEPGVEDLAEQRPPLVERRLTAPARSRRSRRALHAPSRRRAHSAARTPRHLVGGDRCPGSRPAAHDRLVGAAFGDVAGGALAGPGPVVALVAGQSAVRGHVVATPAQVVHERPGRGRVHVARDRDPHDAAAYSRTSPGWCGCRPAANAGRRSSARRSRSLRGRW